MGWNWQSEWLAPILWTRDWSFPARDQNLKHQKHDAPKTRRGSETKPSIPIITTLIPCSTSSSAWPRQPTCENSLDHETWKTPPTLLNLRCVFWVFMWRIWPTIRYKANQCSVQSEFPPNQQESTIVLCHVSQLWHVKSFARDWLLVISNAISKHISWLSLS